ncbi:hypothetical protein SSIL_3349 [Solibacillus silvestris StLB046]|uniref:SLH domain-containing protein n=1 Tax=Solibacillus silvestris (strain StLB046) TaxID=1002809 RepID=F2F3X4_SOLSS|nr:S-layer homology domain-containing protein [Solibacillus silvestris]BAK17772.1 hypothetical protein SSIL_3349 [Solibacillus silvestris StLB046]
MANQPKKYKKFVATAATATLVASAIVPVASAASLTDIAGNTHEEAINSLVDAKVISGYPDGTFQPNKTLTRSDVVKLLGKYLESKGHEVPADYKTNVRFNDLTSASNDELLKYAAVVYDAGVFNGSNGNLLAGDNITRENMAVVLVRAFDTLNNIDLVSYVQDQDYKKDVKDLYTAKSEARSAIEVLDFFDITNPAVSNFNPKGSTTRGQFATFLYKTINTDFSAVTGVANSAVSEIKAINNTTVEVTFKDAVDNIEALDFTIEGLEVKNAVVKQTDAKTVVLTTAAQTGDTVYTLNVNAAKAGTFKGISAVVPTAVTMTTPSVQGKLGQQVTVKAQVTVAEGQSKAGIPVTLYVPGSADGIKAPVTVEAITNAEGVATHTYTRYAATTDAVTVYATGDRSKFATGYVFWGVDTILSITEVTEGATVNNGANKTYKVTYKNPTSGLVEANKTLNVSFAENINVTADKVKNASVNGVNVKQLSNGTVVEAAQITTDSKGEATFTVSGTNTEVTPVVYVGETIYTSSNSNVVSGHSKKYEASSLQATAPKVKFAAVQADYTIELTRDGGEVAAIGHLNGRKYNVLVKGKDGKVAANEVVNVAFNEDIDRVIGTETSAEFIQLNDDGDKVGYRGDKITVKTNSKGEASFYIGNNVLNSYATPVAWIDINSANAKEGQLDEGEPTIVGQISYFQNPYVDGAGIKVTDRAGKKKTKFDNEGPAVFNVNLTNQSGEEYILGTGESIRSVSYTVFNTGANDVYVMEGSSKRVISPNRSYTLTNFGTGNLEVFSDEGKSTSVKVVATGVARYYDEDLRTIKDFNFNAKEATATFTNSVTVTAPYTGYVTQFNAADSGSNSNSLWFADKNPIKYTGDNVKYYGANGNEIFGEQAWENYLTTLVGKGIQVSYSKDGDNTLFKVVSVIDNPTAGTGLVKLGTTTPPAPEFTSTTNVATVNDVNTLGLVGTTATSSDTSVATVAIADGKIAITSVKAGNATITVKNDAGHAATVAVTVNTKGEITLAPVVKYEEQGEEKVTLKDLGFTPTNNIFNGTTIVTVKASTLSADLAGKTLSVTIDGTEHKFVPNAINADNLNITVPTASFDQAKFEALEVTAK